MNKEEREYLKEFKKEIELNREAIGESNITFINDNELYGMINSILDKGDRIDKAIEYIEKHKRKDEFLNLNEWQTRELLEILKGE